MQVLEKELKRNAQTILREFHQSLGAPIGQPNERPPLPAPHAQPVPIPLNHQSLTQQHASFSPTIVISIF
ncbi:hypothetical protein MKX08_000895 [Trichoderma sp. CBMAI-0020]|nr:hypothetical protein MKX08_000895 [Trichoderma sp. CBMAI-0020]